MQKVARNTRSCQKVAEQLVESPSSIQGLSHQMPAIATFVLLSLPLWASALPVFLIPNFGFFWARIPLGRISSKPNLYDLLLNEQRNTPTRYNANTWRWWITCSERTIRKLKGGGGMQGKCKKYPCKGKLNDKNSCRPINPKNKNIHVLAQINSYKGNVYEINVLFKKFPSPINFLIVRNSSPSTLISVTK